MYHSNILVTIILQQPDPSSNGCEDTIYLYPYPLNTSASLDRVTNYIEYGNLDDHPHDSLPMVLKSNMNKQEFAYSSDSNSITIVFRACQDAKASHGEVGHGFRLLAYASGNTDGSATVKTPLSKFSI